MGCDWYSFSAFASSGWAIIVTNKDIKEVRSSGSSKSDSELLWDKLEDDEIDWLFDQAAGFKLYNLADSFVLFMKENNKVISLPRLDVAGPYEIEDNFVTFKIEEAPRGAEYSQLFDLARKLTPPGNKLSFQPGQYSFSMTNSYCMAASELQRPSEVPTEEGKKDGGSEDNDMETSKKPAAKNMVPVDFELVVGVGEKQKVFETNKDILFCVFPGFESLVGEVEPPNKLELPDMNPEAVKIVLDYYCTREKVKMPSRWDGLYQAVEFVKETFEVLSHSKKAKKEHPAMADPRWLDATFLVGPNKEEVKANRAVLSCMNPVLGRILYGTGIISVDPSKPIEWLQFDVEAVRAVFQALVHGGKKEFVVPVESVESAKALVDYIMETRDSLGLYYDTPFKRCFLRGCTLISKYDDDTDDGRLILQDRNEHYG